MVLLPYGHQHVIHVDTGIFLSKPGFSFFVVMGLMGETYLLLCEGIGVILCNLTTYCICFECGQRTVEVLVGLDRNIASDSSATINRPKITDTKSTQFTQPSYCFFGGSGLGGRGGCVFFGEDNDEFCGMVVLCGFTGVVCCAAVVEVELVEDREDGAGGSADNLRIALYFTGGEAVFLGGEANFAGVVNRLCFSSVEPFELVDGCADAGDVVLDGGVAEALAEAAVLFSVTNGDETDLVNLAGGTGGFLVGGGGNTFPVLRGGAGLVGVGGAGVLLPEESFAGDSGVELALGLGLGAFCK